MKSRLLLDVVVRESAAILELLSGKDQALLIRWDSLLVLDLGLDVIDGIGRLNLEGDPVAQMKSQSIRTPSQREDSKTESD